MYFRESRLILNKSNLRMNHSRAFALLLLIMVLAAASSSAEETAAISPKAEMHCPYLNPQSAVDLDEILGIWYVVEVIKHKVDAFHPTRSGHVVVGICPLVEIRSISRATLGLLWTEKAGTLDYTLNVPDPFRGPGYWISKDSQNGTLLNRKYVQFVGTVQVMKAVASHMVLTFCSKTADNQVYSVLLSREHDLPEHDSTGVKNLLSRRGLTIATVQETCTNAGSSRNGSNVTRWMTVFVTTVTGAVLGVISKIPLTSSHQF